MSDILYLCEGAGERELLKALGYNSGQDKRRGGKDKLAGRLIDLIEPKLKSEPVRVCILTDLDSGEALSTVLSRFTEPLQRLLEKHEVDEPLNMGILEGHAHIPTWSLSERADVKIALCFPHPNAARGIAICLRAATTSERFRSCWGTAM